MNRRTLAQSGWMCLIAILYLLVGGFVPAAKADGDYKKAQTLIDSSVTVIGQPVVYPTTGPAHVTALVVTLEPGEATGWHKHGVPVFAYILEGEAVIDYGDGGRHTFKKGDAFLEAIDHWHDGKIVGEKPAKILAVFLGAKGSEKVIKKQPH